MSNPIKYSNVWEDANVLVEVASMKVNPKILSIGSAGDNVFALLTVNPTEIVVVDRDIHQLYLMELKIAAFKCLDYQNLLNFFGVNACSNRIETYMFISHELSDNAQEVWNKHFDTIEKGILHSGKMERFFQSFKWILKGIHSSVKMESLFTHHRSPEEQKRFYEKEWNNWRWRFYYLLVYNPLIFGRKARRAEYLKHVKGKRMSQIFLDRAHKHYASIHVQRNFMVDYMMHNNFKYHLPMYLKPENYSLIKSSLHKIHLEHCDLKQACSKYSGFDIFNLSDVFEYMSVSEFTIEIKTYAKVSNEHALFVYWNLLVDRKMHEVLPEQFEAATALIDRIGAKDLGYFYDGLTVTQKK